MKRDNTASERGRKTGTTAWKIRIENQDLELLKRVAERMAAQDGGMIPKPSITAMIQKAIKNYIADALQHFQDASKEARPRLVGREAGQRIH